MAFTEDLYREVGTVASSSTAIYTAPTTKNVWVTSLLLTNNQATAQTLNVVLYHRDTTTTKMLYNAVLAIGQTVMMSWEGRGLKLERGESIKASTTTNNGCDFVLTAEV